MDITNGTLSGRLTKDPELQTTSNGNTVARARLASTTRGNGSLFVNLTAWGKTGELLNQYCQKGSFLVVAGPLDKEDNWTDKNGNEREGSLRLTVDSLAFGPKVAPAAAADEDLDF
jgi:single stranded DNA-binding protein